MRITVSDEAAEDRLDRFLAEALDWPRNQVQRIIREGAVLVDGGAALPSARLREGAVVSVAEGALRTGEDEPLAPAPFPDDLGVIEEAADFIVLDKPPGLVVHPGAGRPEGTLAQALLGRYPEIASVGHPRRPGIVHRLDVGTSGALVVARSERGYRHLAEAFASRRTTKRYLAIVHGRLDRALDIELPIGRHRSDRRRMTVRRDGRPARSVVHPVAHDGLGAISLVDVELVTGRTHQIRVHLKAADHPLVGDPVYGEARWKTLPQPLRRVVAEFGRPALHAWRLGFEDPATGALRSFTSAPPGDLSALWAAACPKPDLTTVLAGYDPISLA